MLAKENVKAHQVLHALSQRHTKDVWLSEVKTGPSWVAKPGELKRIDGLAIKQSWSSPCITAYEVKVDRQDFLRDEKWPSYREFCHKLYFACPKGLIAADELPEDVGLITYNPETGSLHTAKAARFRDIEIPTAMLYHIVISKTDSDRHPFFSKSREALEAWVEDKVDRKELSHKVRGKLYTVLQDVDQRERDLLRKERRMEEDLELMQKVREILKDFNIREWGDWPQRLREQLASGAGREVAYEVEQAIQRLEKARGMLRAGKAAGE